MKRYLFFLVSCLYIQNIISSSMPLSERKAHIFKKSEEALAQHVIKKEEQLYQSYAQKYQRDIVILNDSFETYRRFKFLKKNAVFNIPAITDQLKNAIHAKQMILCTKSLLRNFYFLNTIWDNFLRTSPINLQRHYEGLRNFSLLEIENIKNIITVLNTIVRTAEINSDYHNFLEKIHEELAKSDINSTLLYYLFMLSKENPELQKIETQYDFYEVNEGYVLLFPHGTQPIDISSIRKVGFNELSRVLDVDLHESIDILLVDALKKVIKNSVSGSTTLSHNDQSPANLNQTFFRWNIFIIGHGIAGRTIIGTSYNNFIAILKYFNKNYITNTLTIMSCYSGGNLLRNFFGHEIISNINPLVQTMQYPILFFGSFFSEIRANLILQTWRNDQQNFNQNNYQAFFKNIKEKDYFAALFAFVPLNESNQQDQIFTNYGAIKFTNVNWITVSDYHKHVFNITKISILKNYPSYVMHIPDSKNLILMNTNILPIEINIDMVRDKGVYSCKFLPAFYMDQNYSINILRLNNVDINPNNREAEIAKIIYDLFDLRLTGLAEPITIFIKQLFVGRYSIENILIKLDEQEKIYYESFDTPGKLVVAHKQDEFVIVEKIDKPFFYITDIVYMKDRLQKFMDPQEFLSDVNPEFIQKLKNIYKPKLNPQAKPFTPKAKSNAPSHLNPQAKPFVPKI